mgnify:CR=1 FL=1
MKREEVERVAIEAAKFLYEHREDEGISKVIGFHGNDTTRVIDKKSEEYIFSLLKSTGYKFLLVSEESGTIFSDSNYDYIAIIDPLDGSTNYISGIPWSSVSIAIYKRGEEDLLNSITGAVANVFTSQIYSYDEKNAYINGKVIEKVTPPDKILLLAYFSRSKLIQVKEFLDKLDSYKIRSLGSASLDMILVCTGKATMFFDVRGKLRNVDIAASSNFCERVGIQVYNSKLQKIRSSLTKVSVIEDVIVSLDQNLLHYLSSALQKV